MGGRFARAAAKARGAGTTSGGLSSRGGGGLVRESSRLRGGGRDSVTVSIRGVDKLVKRLKAIADEINERAVVKIISEAAEPIREEMEKLVPEDTGKGRENIVNVPIDKSNTKAAVQIGPAGPNAPDGKEDVFYLMFQEIGTKYHKAQPFIRPAFDNKKGKTAAIIERELEFLIEEHTA